MRLYGRDIDVVGLWENYVQFPPNADFTDKYLPKVQCPNPEHDTLKRHFQINQDDGLVHCFAYCGISGNMVRAISMVEGCDEKTAAKIILRYVVAGTAGTVRKARTKGQFSGRTNSGAVTIVPDLSFDTYIPAYGLEYLESRKISPASIARWELGWDGENKRIVIPAKDERGQLKFLIQRAVTEKQWPKYLYTEGVSKNSLLFGACNVSLGVLRSMGMVLVEGSLDAITLHQHGFNNVCAILGTGISKAQAEIVARFRPRKIYLMFDKDVSGVHNIEIARKRLSHYPLFVCRYPAGKSDPAEMTKEEATRSISRAIPVSRFFRISTRTRRGVEIGN